MNATIRESGEIRFVCDAHYLQTKCAYAIVDILRAEFADARTFAKSWPNRTSERSRCVIHTSLHIARRSMSACPASLHAAVPRAPRRAPRARACTVLVTLLACLPTPSFVCLTPGGLE